MKGDELDNRREEDIFSVISRIERSRQEIAPGIRAARLPFLEKFKQQTPDDGDTAVSPIDEAASPLPGTADLSDAQPQEKTAADSSIHADRNDDLPRTEAATDLADLPPDCQLDSGEEAPAVDAEPAAPPTPDAEPAGSIWTPAERADAQADVDDTGSSDNTESSDITGSSNNTGSLTGSLSDVETQPESEREAAAPAADTPAEDLPSAFAWDEAAEGSGHGMPTCGEEEDEKTASNRVVPVVDENDAGRIETARINDDRDGSSAFRAELTDDFASEQGEDNRPVGGDTAASHKDRAMPDILLPAGSGIRPFRLKLTPLEPLAPQESLPRQVAAAAVETPPADGTVTAPDEEVSRSDTAAPFAEKALDAREVETAAATIEQTEHGTQTERVPSPDRLSSEGALEPEIDQIGTEHGAGAITDRQTPVDETTENVRADREPGVDVPASDVQSAVSPEVEQTFVADAVSETAAAEAEEAEPHVERDVKADRAEQDIEAGFAQEAEQTVPHRPSLRFRTFAETLAFTRRMLPLAHEMQLDSQSVQHVWLMTQLKRADTPEKLEELASRLNYKDLGILFPTLATLTKRGQTEQVQALIRLRASTYLYYHGWTTLQIAYPRAFVAKALSDLCIQLEDRLYALSDVIPARQGRRHRPDLGPGRVVWSDVPLISEIALPSSRHFISDVARAALDADVPAERFFTNYAISPDLPLGETILARMREIETGTDADSPSLTRSFFDRYLR